MATVKVPVYQPQLQVTLWKTIKRESLGDGAPVSARFQGTGQKVDLTPFLGEGSAVRTAKGVRDPAGVFSLTLVDKAYAGTLVDSTADAPSSSAETLYGLVEPMDGIEIRMRHGTGTGDQLPIVMRGFVSDVDRDEGIGQDGRPSRVVLITGQDYGKLWQMLQILYLPGYVVGQDTISTFKLFERFGVGFKTANPAGEFVTDVVKKILNVYLANIFADDSPVPKTIVVDEDQLVAHGTVSLTGPQNKEGTIYDLMREFCDVGIWNELFLEDREDGVFCVFRPNPYKNLAGDKIVADSSSIEVIEVDAADVLSLKMKRSDANVANYFWTRSPRFEMSEDVVRRQRSVTGDEKKTVLLGDYANTSDKLYGIRAMFVETQMGGDEVQTFNSGLPEADLVAREALQNNWINYRRRLLVDMNKDNVVLERGVCRLRGNEAIRAGMEMKLTRGKLSASYYVVHVTHDHLPFQGFFTTLLLERGTGFVERASRNGGPDSPYYAELSQ